MGKREDFVMKAISWQGTTAKSAGHKQILADYNKACDSGRKADLSTPWCAEFVGACAQETDNVLKDGIGVPVDCSCGTGAHSMMAKAKAAGIWVEDDAYRPSMGIAPSAGRIQASIYGVCTVMEQLYPGDAATHL